MALFPGDMHIGWGFGLEPQQEYSYDGFTWFDVRDGSVPSLAKQVREKTSPNWDDEHSGEQKTYDFRDEPECDPDGYNPDETQLTDPLLAVSELEEKVHDSQVVLAEGHVQLEKRLIDLEERLRSLTIVVNTVVEELTRIARDEGRIDGHRAILTSLVGKVATLENRLKEKE